MGDDPELELLRYLWLWHNMTPQQFYSLPEGERVLIHAFCLK